MVEAYRSDLGREASLVLVSFLSDLFLKESLRRETVLAKELVERVLAASEAVGAGFAGVVSAAMTGPV